MIWINPLTTDQMTRKPHTKELTIAGNRESVVNGLNKHIQSTANAIYTKTSMEIWNTRRTSRYFVKKTSKVNSRWRGSSLIKLNTSIKLSYIFSTGTTVWTDTSCDQRASLCSRVPTETNIHRCVTRYKPRPKFTVIIVTNKHFTSTAVVCYNFT